MLNRRPDESDLDYHRRLITGKLTDKTLADIDYCELAPLLYDQAYSSDSTRKMMYGSAKTLQLLDKEVELAAVSAVPREILDELEMKKIELAKERQRFFDQRNAYNKLLRERARQEELNEIVSRSIESGSLPVLEYVDPEICASDNDLLVSLNDIHYGAVVDNYWRKYDSDVCARMMAAYVARIMEIAATHQSQNCIVWMNGDAISGSIHHSLAVTNKENVIEQVTGVSELIAQFIAQLSECFEKVTFVSVAGNHSRMDQKDRALMQERLDDLVEWYLKARLSGYPNVVIGGDKIDSTMYAIDIRGRLYVGVHGDFDPTPSHIQALQTMVGRNVYAVLLGHMHHNAANNIQGIRTVMAGSFLGMDDYCISKRIYGKPEQMVCVCDENGIRCSYDIDLSDV